jgi:soluble lytic murein transglycosylase
LAGVRIFTGDQALLLGDYTAALEAYQAAFDQTGDPATQAAALLGIGRTRLGERNYYLATQALQRVVDEFSATPHIIQAYFFLGRAHEGLEQYAQAAQAYENYLQARPGMAEAYIHDLHGSALFAAGDYSAAAEAFRNALASPSTLDRIFVQLKLARAVGLSGDPDAALALYEDANLRTDDDYTRALIALRKGQIYQSIGQNDQAMAIYQEAVAKYPRAYEAYSALQALDQANIPVDELQRGLVTYFAGQYGLAMAAFDRYLQRTPPDPGTALYYYGLANRQQGQHSAALQQWDRLIENYTDHRFWSDAWEQKGYTQWAFLQDFEASVETFLGFVEKSPGHSRAAEFLFNAALVAERSADLPRAAEIFMRVINVYPDYERAPRALFLAAITRYRMADYPAALQTFQRYQGQAVTLQDRAAAAFWIGKTQFAQGDAAAAHETWVVAAAIDPTNYYSERAADLAAQRPPFTIPSHYDLSFNLLAERMRAAEWVRETFKLPAEENLLSLGPLASEPGLARGAELWELGLYDEARAELEAVRIAVQHDPALTFRLSNYLLDLGLYRSAIIAARQVLALAYLDGSNTLSAPAYFNHVRFGPYYADTILPLAQEKGFHPLLLFAVTRQESLFEGFVRSSAGARGLMQIMPATGADLAQRLGWPANYDSEDLYRPLVSLTLGADYLARQVKAFDGSLHAALAAYNAGPGNALQWQRLAPDDPDLFLELIRFEETRNYIRGVYELYTIYKLIYNPPAN